MLDFLIDLDKSALLLCNGTHTLWLDNFNWMITARWFNVFVALPLLVMMGLVIFKHKKQGVIEAMLVIVALALAVLIADQVASSFFKPLFQRLRPSHDPSLSVILVNDYHGGRYGFVSSHAANTFAAAVLLLNIFRNKYFSVVILLWAILVSYSRIYLGVHFPAILYVVLCWVLQLDMPSIAFINGRGVFLWQKTSSFAVEILIVEKIMLVVTHGAYCYCLS